jgi:tryptophan synthase alpha chain
MRRISRLFDALKKRGQAALIPFIMAGDPDLETTKALVYGMAEAGADLIEIGIPFSDPLADGPTIQSASQRSLKNGVGPLEVFSLLERMEGIGTPLILMTYFNPVLRFGLKEFAGACRKSGADGVIIPDLPPEEAGTWVREARREGVATIFFIAPTSPPSRVRLVSRYSRGFTYYVSVTGVTGARESLPDELESAVRGIREQTHQRVVVGFGVSSQEQAQTIGRFADGVIVGSALVRMIEQNLENPELIVRVQEFVFSLATALKGSSLDDHRTGFAREK